MGRTIGKVTSQALIWYQKGIMYMPNVLLTAHRPRPSHHVRYSASAPMALSNHFKRHRQLQVRHETMNAHKRCTAQSPIFIGQFYVSATPCVFYFLRKKTDVFPETQRILLKFFNKKYA